MIISLPAKEIKRIDPKTFQRFYREKYKNPLAKGLFFLMNEGLGATIRKYRSKVIEKRIENEQKIIIALIELNRRKYLGFTRHIGHSYVFDVSLIFEVPEDFHLGNVTLSDDILTLLESYLPVPSCPVPCNLPFLILKLNPCLESLKNTSIFEEFDIDKLFQDKPSGKFQEVNRRLRVDNQPGNVYLFGFGSYVREYVLSNFSNQIVAGVDYKADLIKSYVPVQFPLFNRCEDILDMVSKDPQANVIISSYHSDHAPMALAVLDANPEARVFIEKPVSVEFFDVERLVHFVDGGAWVDVGYNRRYALLTRIIKERLGNLPRPLVITAIVKELKLPEIHWYFWPNQGTRITGNVCHWIDLAVHFIRLPPTEITLLNTGDNVCIGILFQDGSMANIVATDRGDDLPGVEELIEIRGGETTITLYDFKELVIRSGRYRKRIKRFRRDKGHTAMYRDLKDRWQKGMPPLYSPKDLYWVSYIISQASKMLVSGQRIHRITGHNDSLIKEPTRN